MKRLSSYQKLKKRIRELETDNTSLRSDIRNLVLKPNSPEGKKVETEWRIHYTVKDSMDRGMWWGDKSDNNEFSGLI